MWRKWPYFSFQPLWQELFFNLFDPGSLSISQCFFYPTAQGRIREAQEAGGLEVKMFSVLFFLIICLRHVARESQAARVRTTNILIDSDLHLHPDGTQAGSYLFQGS